MTRPLAFAIPGDLGRRTGGYGYDRRLIAALPAQGWQAQVLALDDGFPDPSPAALDRAAAALGGLPDGGVVLVDGLAGGVLGEALAKAARRMTVVYLCHHPLALETGLPDDRRRELAASERAALGAAHGVVVTSPATAEALVADFGVPRAAVAVALPGTDPRPPAPGGNTPPVLLTVASLIPRKGHDVLVDALARLADLAWAARFVGGDGFDPAWAAGLRDRVDRAGLASRIAFVGEVDDPLREYLSADLFVLPSRHEGYGMVFAEALAHGLPVVAARAGAVADVVPEAAGAMVPPDDPAALAAAIGDLLRDPGRMANARAAALDAGRRLPTFDDTARNVAAALERATART